MGSEVMTKILERLEKFLQTKTVIGEPMQVGNVTLIPIISVSFGLGGGGGDSKGEDSGEGGGAGGSVVPKAILVIKGDEVSMMPINDKGSLEKIIAMVPEIVEKVQNQSNKDKKE